VPRQRTTLYGDPPAAQVARSFAAAPLAEPWSPHVNEAKLPKVRRVSLPTLAAILVLALAPAGSARTEARAAAPAPVTMRAVVRAWSARLNAGDNRGVARLFALPAVMIQGPYAYRLKTRAQVASWHSALPCSGRIVSIAIHGRYADAVFRLGNRGSSKCDGPGTLAAARFEIRGGKIVSWEQIAVPAKQADNGPVA
jgi:hypothetical protein